MQFEEIKQIVSLMKENEISFFRLENGEDKIELKRGLDMEAVKDLMKAVRVVPASAPAPAGYGVPDYEMGSAPPYGGLTPRMPERVEPAAGPTVNSPMVGTFYRSPNPEDGPFVAVGDRITKDSVVCIIEAMKVMNEIKAEKSGVIKQVLIEDGTPVQYGEALFELEA